jgi:hypothetical protein
MQRTTAVDSLSEFLKWIRLCWSNGIGKLGQLPAQILGLHISSSPSSTRRWANASCSADLTVPSAHPIALAVSAVDKSAK